MSNSILFGFDENVVIARLPRLVLHTFIIEYSREKNELTTSLSLNNK